VTHVLVNYVGRRIPLEEAKKLPEYAAIERAAKALDEHSVDCRRCYPKHSTQQVPGGPCDNGRALLAAFEDAKRTWRVAIRK